MLYAILIIAIAYLFVRILFLPRAKRNERGYVASFQEAVSPVEFAIAEKMEKKGYKVDDFCRLINDQGQGIVFAFDSVHDVFAVGMKDSMVFESGAKLKDVTKTYGDKIGRKYSTAEVSFSIDDTVYRYTIAHEPFNPKGFVSRNIVEITENLYNGLLRVQNKERTKALED
ncbi:MAG: hypothetical protein KBS81_09920 [Spirochaetales bacterium]|nr:hypothetical protein [Candidatus Physcosoma equi]